MYASSINAEAAKGSIVRIDDGADLHQDSGPDANVSGREFRSSEDKEKGFVTEQENENILSLKISRSGHLFAVITLTSLTIWQTKVGK